MSQLTVRFEPLDGHPREAFSCKHRSIQHFFRKWAGENHASYTQRVMVACANGAVEPLGFYGLTLMTFETGLGDEADARYKDRRVPTIYMASLARDKKLSTPGFGNLLLEHALKQCLAVRETVGVYAMSLHAANERVATIYQDFGFHRFENGAVEIDRVTGEEMPAMFIRLADAAEAFAQT